MVKCHECQRQCLLTIEADYCYGIAICRCRAWLIVEDIDQHEPPVRLSRVFRMATGKGSRMWKMDYNPYLDATAYCPVVFEGRSTGDIWGPDNEHSVVVAGYVSHKRFTLLRPSL